MSQQPKLQSRKTAASQVDSTASQAHSPQRSDETLSNTTALIREVTKQFSDIIEKKLSVISGTLEKISTSVWKIQSKRIVETEKWISDVEGTVFGLEVAQLRTNQFE
jgi:phenylpyruvate tautomerase PptA (4-oxalocrotonate tautomerase family)